MRHIETTKFSYLDQFKIIKTLGSGYHAQVKLASDQNGNLYAIKRYKKQTASLKTLQHELNVMKILRHQNLVKLYDVRENATYKRKDETTYKCFAIILEYVGGGELFDFVAETGKFSEKVTRTYFHQMMNGLYFMHTKGYAHRDIKPQNILLSRSFTLKLADFGFTCPLKGKDGSGILRTKLGTEGYMAPQIPTKNYRGTQSDIFAAGVILFIMFAGNPPFEKASLNDPYYKLIRQKNYSTFWKAHSRNRSKNFFSEGFKNLFVKMVAFEPSERPTIEQIASHSWVRGPICTQNQIKNQFELRKKRLDMVMDKKREEKQAQNKAILKNAVSLTVSKREQWQVDQKLVEIYQRELQISRQLTYMQPLNNEDFTVSENISYVVSALKYFFGKKKIRLQDQLQVIFDNPTTIQVLSIEDQQNKLKISLQYSITLDQHNYTEQIELQIKLGETMDEKIAVCFEHLSGNRFYYKRIISQVKKLFTYCQQS